MNRESMDKQTRHVSSVQRRLSRFETMTSEEVADTMRETCLQVTERWESCDKSFKQLFEVLNRGPAGSRNLYDIKVEHEEHAGVAHERYLRISKDEKAGTYKIRNMVFVDRVIKDHTFPEIEIFSDTYEYTFGTAHSHSAKIKMRDYMGGGIKMERSDGKLVDGVSQYEKAVLLAAMEDMINPSLENNIESLMLLWDSIQNEEWNPIHANAYKAFQNRWN